MGLEGLIHNMEKTMVIGDLHIPHTDYESLEIVKAFAKDYKPDRLVINGDLCDFYTLSVFDKNPHRKMDVQEELDEASNILGDLRKTVGPKCKIILTEGNHEQRLQRFLWRNPELECLRAVRLPELLNVKKYNIDFVGADGDYWKNDNGHVEVGDAIIMHGDNRLNGGSTSKYSGYSAKNTMMSLQKSVLMNHVHRLALVKHQTPYSTLTGVECGSLCKPAGTYNWQQGFVTFETTKQKKNVNYRLHHIEDHKLFVDGNMYYT